MSARLCVAKMTPTFFLRSVWSHWRMRAAKTVVQNSQDPPDQRVGAPPELLIEARNR